MIHNTPGYSSPYLRQSPTTPALDKPLSQLASRANLHCQCMTQLYGEGKCCSAMRQRDTHPGRSEDCVVSGLFLMVSSQSKQTLKTTAGCSQADRHSTTVVQQSFSRIRVYCEFRVPRFSHYLSYFPSPRASSYVL